jgi:hypothetical protein
MFAQISVTRSHMLFSHPRTTILFSLLTGICLAAVTHSSLAADERPIVQRASDIVVSDQLDMAGLHRLDGSEDSATISLQRWRQAVFELQKGAAVQLDWPRARQLSQAAQRQMAADSNWKRIPLAAVHARYERENEALARQAQNVFAFSPLVEKLYHGQEFEFLLDAESFLNYAVEEPDELWLDADDGLGFRALQLGTPFPVNYSSTGIKSLVLQARMPDGSIQQSTAQVDVPQLVTPDPDETWNITASVEYGGIAGSGTAYVYRADGHASLENPVVIVEGFDLDNSLGWPELYDLLNRENLLEDLRAAGFDAVVLDFTEAVDPIQRNGFVLTELLQMVNSETPPDQTSAIVGASMGGLVSRYALLWMEDQDIPHQVRKLISFDSPQSGANIPLGMQAWVEFFAGEAEEAEFLLEQLRSPASKQMLLYHVDGTSGTTANPDPLFTALQSEFSSLGNWPADPRLVSIINGSGSMLGQSFNPGDQIIEWNYNIVVAAIDGDVWALPDGGTKKIFDGRIFLLLSNAADSLTISGTLPWDNSPGGSRPTMKQAADVEAPFGDIIALHESHSFIPTISALALDTNDPFYDVAGDADLLDHTAFDTVYYPAANQEHIDITPQNKLWFMAEVQSQILVSMISGDTTESGGTATFTITPASAPSEPVTIGLSSSLPGEGTVPVNVVLPKDATDPVVVIVTGADDPDVDGDMPYTIITASSTSDDPAYNGIDPADVAVINLDNEPKVELIFEDGFEDP